MDSLNPFTRSNLLVVKIGSALLFDSESGSLRTEWLSALCDDIKKRHDQQTKIVLVSSGAIALGRGRLGLLGEQLSLPQKQACAATGQVLLTQAYETQLAKHGIQTAQILLTLQDTEVRRRWLNARATMSALLDLGVIPIINENDTVATDEIRYGDNDRLAARTAQMIGADTLILLSDIDGLYTGDPRRDDDARHLSTIETLSPDIMAMGGTANFESGIGSGGMATKLAAAQIATQAGCYMCIMDGQTNSPLTRLSDGERCTWFKASQNPKDARRQWISGHLDAKGSLTIDDGASLALSNGKSLLAAGVVRVDGAFAKGDTIKILDSESHELAQGIASYSADETRKIMGKKSMQIAEILGYDYGAALIHRDNLVMSQ